MTSEGNPKLIDFGLATTTGDYKAERETSLGGIVGTRCYMSPEQFDGRPAVVDARSDVYGLGVVLFELLTGSLPYDIEDRTLLETAEIVRSHTPYSLTRFNRKLGRDLDTILNKALQKEPSARYQSIDEFADDLRNYLAQKPIAARRRSIGSIAWKLCVRHKTTALIGSFAMLALAALMVSTVVFASISHRRAQALARTNDLLEKRSEGLRQSHARLTASSEALRRQVSNQTLMRLGNLHQRNPAYVRSQLYDQDTFPAEFRGFSWQVLDQSVRQPVTSWQAAEKGLLDLAIADDGAWAAVAHPTGVAIWDIDSQKVIAKTAVRPSSPRVRLAVDGVNKQVLFCRESDGLPVALDIVSNDVTKIPLLPGRKVTAIALSDSAERGLLADSNGMLSCHSEHFGLRLWKHQICDSKIIAVAVSKDESLFGAVNTQGEVFVGELDTGAVLTQQQALGAEQVNYRWSRARFSGDLDRVALCAWHDRALVWSLKKQTMLREFTALHGLPDAVFPPEDETYGDDTFMISGRGRVILRKPDSELATLYDRKQFLSLKPSDGRTSVGNVNTEGVSATTSSLADSDLANRDWEPIAIDMTPDGARTIIALPCGQIVACDQPSLYKNWSTAHSTAVKLRFSADGSMLATTSGGGAISVHETEHGNLLWRQTLQGKRTHDFHFVLNDSLLMTRRVEHGLSLLDVRTGESIISTPVTRRVQQILPFKNRIWVGVAGDQSAWVDWKQNDGAIATLGAAPDINGVIELLDFDSASGLIAFRHSEPRRVSVGKLSSDGVLTISFDKEMNGVKTMSLSPGGEYLVTGFNDGALIVWKTATLDQLISLTPNPRPVGGLDFSPDGSVLAAGHFDGEVVLWDTKAWEPQLSVRTNLNPIRDVCFSPSGNQLAISGKGSHIAVLNLGIRK